MLTLFSFSLAKSSILIVSCKSFVIVTGASSSEESVKIKLILALIECYLYLLRQSPEVWFSEWESSLSLSCEDMAGLIFWKWRSPPPFSLFPPQQVDSAAREPTHVAGPAGGSMIWTCPEPISLHTTKGFPLVLYLLPSSHLPLPAGTLPPVSQLPHPHSAEAPTSLPSGHSGSRE